MKLVTTLLVLALLSTQSAYGAERWSFEELFHIKPKTAEKLYGKKAYQRLNKAAADFNAVISGKKPINAKKDTEPLPADGGTSYYVGDGYKLTILKSLNDVVHGKKYFGGYMYGPIITFEDNLLSGNHPSISHITFYPDKELMKLLGEN